MRKCKCEKPDPVHMSHTGKVFCYWCKREIHSFNYNFLLDICAITIALLAVWIIISVMSYAR